MKVSQEEACYRNECNHKGCANIGGSNKLIYDECSYKKALEESTKPLSYYLYESKFENCGKCVHDKFYRPFDLVDVESDLKNITRTTTRCPERKYNKKYNKYDDPVVLSPELCPIVRNNIPKQNNVGFSVPEDNLCGGRYFPKIPSEEQ